jgi:hypothetical protein
MSASDKARADLVAKIRQDFALIQNAAAVMVKRINALQMAADLEPAMAEALEIIISGEQLADTVTQFNEHCRAALAACIDDTGCPEVVTLHHKATMARKPAFVSIDGMFRSDDGRFWNAPTPNKRAIKEALEAGEAVPGCELRRPNSMTLRITTRK